LPLRRTPIELIVFFVLVNWSALYRKPLFFGQTHAAIPQWNFNLPETGDENPSPSHRSHTRTDAAIPRPHEGQLSLLKYLSR
jgi:hypothetical protein